MLFTNQRSMLITPILATAGKSLIAVGSETGVYVTIKGQQSLYYLSYTATVIDNVYSLQISAECFN